MDRRKQQSKPQQTYTIEEAEKKLLHWLTCEQALRQAGRRTIDISMDACGRITRIDVRPGSLRLL
jgi:hypothetical protein